MKRIVVILTACLLLIGATLTIAAQSTAPVASLEYEDLEYRENPNITAGLGTAQMGDVLSGIEGLTVTDAEKAYIRYEFDGQHVLYFTKPALGDKQFEYDGELQELTVVVQGDSYSPARYDTIIDWIPVSASIATLTGTSTASFEPAEDLGENYYRAVLYNVPWSPNMTPVVEYRAKFEVAAGTLNDFVNFAYEQALLLTDEYAVYEAELAAYKVLMQAYEQNRGEWSEYEQALDQYKLHLALVEKYQDYLIYQEYLKRLNEYQTAHDAFLANQAAWTKYYQDCIKFEQYVDYKYNVHPSLNQTYQGYMEKAQQQLDMLALLKVKDPNTGYSFIEMMMSDRIAPMIEERRAEMVILLGEGTVNAVITSTQELQKFCTKYQSLTTDQEKYNFYIKEHASFVKHLRQLYDNIKKLYEKDIIYQKLQEEYPEHIVTLVRMLGSLYVQRCVFDDRTSLNLNTVVDTRGKQTAGKLVHVSVRPSSDNNNATPLSEWPVAPIDPETYEVKVEPTEPSITLEDATPPAKPEFSTVKHEDELDEYMEEPVPMEQPTPPESELLPHPGSEPALNWNEREQSLYDAYLAGTVAQRPEFEQDQTAYVHTTVNFPIKPRDDELRYYVYFYNTDDQGTYLGHSLGVEYGQPATVPEHLLTATKAPEVKIAYEFVEWVDANGDPINIDCMTEDVEAFATYVVVPRKYNVTWDVGDAPIVEQWEYGQTPVFGGSTDKSPSAQYEYSFIGWDKQFAAVTGDVTYTALYDNTIRRYDVIFDMGDGTRVEGNYTYGQDLAAVAATLTKPYLAPTAQYTYTFKGWEDAHGNLYTDHTQFPMLSEDMTFTAVFDQTVNVYTVTWVVDGKTTQTSVAYGDMPVFGEIPIKESDERYHYDFAGWETEFVPVTGDVTYTAKEFDKRARLYQIDFVIEGQAHTFYLEYEQLPKFEETPQKDSDVQYDYTFIGWDSEPVPVREDAIYIAEFGKILRKYPVKFVVGGNEVIAEFEYGKVPKYPSGTPTKPFDSEYYYVFAEWDKPLAAVDGTEVTYTARFEALPLAPGQDENGKLNVGKDGEYELKLQGTQVDLAQVFEMIGQQQAQGLRVFFGDAVLTFPKSQVDAFYSMGNGIGKVTVALAEIKGEKTYQIELLDQSGAPVAYLVSELTVMLPYSGEYTADVFRVLEDGTRTKLQVEHKDGHLVFSTMDVVSTYVVAYKYQINKNPSENGVFDVTQDAYGGETVTITPDPDEGYHVDSIVVESNGETVKVDSEDGKYSFIMPDGNVNITTIFKVVEGGTTVEVIIGVVTALLIVAIGLIIAFVLHRKKSVKL